VGPQAVEAGPCDRCGQQPRLLPTCGPSGGVAVCRGCAAALGDDGWCAGHREEGAAARAWAATLPDRWAELVTWWWVATGEVRPDVEARGTDLPDLAALASPRDSPAEPG
jgi:hypothetical protein